MGWFRRGPSEPTEADRALREARGKRQETQRREAELEPLLARLEAHSRANYIAEAVEDTMRRRRR